MEDWKPTTEVIAWAEEHLTKIPVGGIWSPDDSGVQYRKMAENTFALMFMYDHPMAKEMHEKFKTLMAACDIELLVPDDVDMRIPPMGSQTQAEEEFFRKQEIAFGWTCECGEPLANSDLSNRVDEYVDTIDVETSNKDIVSVESWMVKIKCISCDTEIRLEVDDYHILAGDELFMSCKTSKGRYNALTRHEILHMVDGGVITDGVFDASINNEDKIIVMLGSNRDGEKVPPWMWGITAVRNLLSTEEE